MHSINERLGGQPGESVEFPDMDMVLDDCLRAGLAEHEAFEEMGHSGGVEHYDMSQIVPMS